MDLEASIGIDLNPLTKTLKEAGLKMDSFAKKFDDLDKMLKGTEKSFDKQGAYLRKYGDDIEKVAERMKSSIEGKMHRAFVSSGQSIEDFMKTAESIDYSKQIKQINDMLDTIKEVRVEIEKLGEIKVGESVDVGGVDATLVSSPSERNILGIYERKAIEQYKEEMKIVKESQESQERHWEIEDKFHDIKMKNIDAIQTKYSEKFQGISNGFETASNIASDFLRTMAAPIAGGVLSAKTWLDFNEEMVGVQKTADLTKQEMESLSDTFREFALDEPIKVGDLAGIAQVGGRMDLDVGEIEEYTKIVSMMGVAFDGIAPEAAAEKISQFMKITGSDVQDIEHLGSAITYLGNNFETTEGKVLSTALRIASTGQMIGMSEADILGLSGAMSGLGINAEMGGSAVSRTLQRMDSAVRSGSDELKMFARISGMTVNEFTRAWSEEPEKVLMHLTNGLAQLNEDGKDVYGIMADMGISNHREVDVLLKMSSAQGEVKKAIEGANEAYKEGTALREEYEVMKESDAGRYVILQNQLAEVRMEIGRNLMPAMEGLITALEALNDFIAKIPDEWLQAIGMVGTAFVVVAGIIAPIAGILSKIFGWISKIAKSKIVADLLAGKGLAAFGKLGTFIGKIGTAIGKVASWIMALIKGGTIGTLLASIGKIVGIILAVVGALWAAWEIGKFVIDLFKNMDLEWPDLLGGAQKAWEGVKELFKGTIDWIVGLFTFDFEWPDLLMPARVAWQGVKDLFKSSTDWVVDLFTFDFEWPDLLAPAKKAWGGVKDFFSSSVDWVKDLFTFDFEWPSFLGGGGGDSGGGGGIRGSEVSWNAEGGVFTQPTIFATPRAGLQGVGEAGTEAIIPLTKKVLGDIGAGIAVTMNQDSGNGRIEALLVEQIKATMGLGDRIEKLEVQMDGRAVGSIVTPYVNSNLGKEQKFNNSRFR